MTRYTNGANFERQIKKAFEDSGWWVQRSAGSHGEADLVALAANCRPVLVQCKKEETDVDLVKMIGKAKPNNTEKEIMALAQLADQLDCKAVWVDKFNRKPRYRRIELIRNGQKEYKWSDYEP